MTPVLILSTFLMAASATYLLYFLTQIVNAWWQNECLMEQGERMSVKIVQVEVIDDENRLVPFVRMKLEVSAEENFVCAAEGFYKRSELPYLQVGNFVSAVLHPTDKRKVQLVKGQPKTPRSNEPTAVLSIRPKQKLSVA